MKQLPSSVPDKEDREILKGKSPSYIYGWNKVKHRDKGKSDELDRGAVPVARAKRRKGTGTDAAAGSGGAAS